MAAFDTPKGSFGTWTWCLHCYQIQPTQLWADKRWRCPSDGCDGSVLDAHDPMKRSGWPRETYQGTEFQASLDTPVPGAYFPLYKPSDPYELAKIGKPGRWFHRGGLATFVADGQDPEEALAHEAEVQAKARAAAEERERRARQPLTISAWHGQQFREGTIIPGRTYVVLPLNKAKTRNRGRACEVVGFVHDEKGVLVAADVRFVDTRRRGRVSPEDLYAEGLVVDSARPPHDAGNQGQVH